MRITNILKGTQGFAKAYENRLRWQHMRNKAEVERRLKALDHLKKYGLNAACDHAGVSQRTLYRWRASFVDGGKIESLDPKSTAPLKRRRRLIPPDIESAIISLRTEHPRLGKKKLTPLLRKAGFAVSEPTIGRYVNDLKKRGSIPMKVKLSFYARSGKHIERLKSNKKRLRRPIKRGVEIDTVVRYVNGVKRYTITAIDVQRRLAYAKTYTSHSSNTARDFLKHLLRYMPFEITEIQTDNGSEFAKHFSEACRILGIIQYHTYPRCPKMNAFIERFNRTVNEEFLIYNRMLMRDDIDAFNAELRAWLVWYNHTRPHESLGLLSPMEYSMRN